MKAINSERYVVIWLSLVFISLVAGWKEQVIAKKVSGMAETKC